MVLGTQYDTFTVGNESTMFTLSVSGFNGSVTGDAMNYHNGLKFSTKDRDNDVWSSTHCAQYHGGGFWYNSCFHCGVNVAGGDFRWYHKSDWSAYESLRTSRMWLVCR